MSSIDSGLYVVMVRWLALLLWLLLVDCDDDPAVVVVVEVVLLLLLPFVVFVSVEPED